MCRLERYDFGGWEKSVQVCLLNCEDSSLNKILFKFSPVFLTKSFCLGKNESILNYFSTCSVAGFYFIFLVLIGRIRQMSPFLCRNPFHVMVFLNKQVNWCSSLALRILKQQHLKVYFKCHSEKKAQTTKHPTNIKVKNPNNKLHKILHSLVLITCPDSVWKHKEWIISNGLLSTCTGTMYTWTHGRTGLLESRG